MAQVDALLEESKSEAQPQPAVQQPLVVIEEVQMVVLEEGEGF